MDRRRVIVLRHGDDPPDDRAHTWLWTRGFEAVVLRPYAGDAIPELDGSIAGSVVHGGPFNVFEEDVHPFLHEENRWIRQCLDRDVPLLGICQGAQSIARVLGAEVGPPDSGLHEFGCYEIRPTPEAGDFLTGPLHVPQAHFHAFAIPDGAVRLAESDLFPNQAFRVGDRAYGFQFHPEMTIEAFRRWQAAPWAAYGQPGAQTREEQDRLLAAHDAAVAAWFHAFLEGLFGSDADDPPPLTP
jgi:GMP synthase (glutamine-hydrolysing)